jgi:hypothetical protein
MIHHRHIRSAVGWHGVDIMQYDTDIARGNADIMSQQDRRNNTDIARGHSKASDVTVQISYATRDGTM